MKWVFALLSFYAKQVLSLFAVKHWDKKALFKAGLLNFALHFAEFCDELLAVFKDGRD